MRWTCVVAVMCLAACGTKTPDAPDLGAEPDLASPDAADAADDVTHDVAPDMPPACSPVFLAADDEPFDTLDEYCLFADPVRQVPSDGVIPFEPIAVLYADESLKARYIAVPDGASITFDPTERWTFPLGTTLIKTFYFYDDARDPSAGQRLLETRLLVNRETGWESYIYVWNESQTEARFERLGAWVELDRINESGATVATRYRVPNKNQCSSCHEQSDVVVPLGPRAFQLHSEYDYGGATGRRNQLEYWAELGILSGVPADLAAQFALSDYIDGAADLTARARSYLEVNCAHCHSDGGAADSSGLRLSVSVTEPGELGVCRRPVAAGAGSGGFFFDIVPGTPEESIMVFRMASTDPEIKMPELPTQLADDFGVQLISEWIRAMSPTGCPQ